MGNSTGNSTLSFCQKLLTGTCPQLPDVQLYGLVNGVVNTLSCIYLLSVLSAQYRSQHDEQFLPLLQLLNPQRGRLRSDRPGSHVLPRYHTFIAFGVLSGLVQSFAFISPTGHTVRVAIVSLTSILSLQSDLLVVIQLLRPVRRSEGRTLLIATVASIGVFLAQLALPEEVLPNSCDFCGVHFLKPSTAYVWLAVGTFFAWCALCSEFGRHPLQPPARLCRAPCSGEAAAWRVRPALAGWCAFLAFPFLASSLAILLLLETRPTNAAGDCEPSASGNFGANPVVRRTRPLRRHTRLRPGCDVRARRSLCCVVTVCESPTTGFCVLAVCDAFYSCGYAPMLLRTVKADSAFSRECMLNDAVGESDAGRAWAVPSGAEPRELSEGVAPEGGAATAPGAMLLSVLSIPQFQLIDPLDLTQRRRIGAGGFGEVSFALWRGAPVAVKQLRVQAACGETLKRLAGEARTLAALRHPNTVLFIGATLSPTGCSLVTEFMPGGSVSDLITARHEDGGGALAWGERLLVLSSAAHGMAYLHSKRLAHRDLKSANVGSLCLHPTTESAPRRLALATARPLAPAQMWFLQETARSRETDVACHRSCCSTRKCRRVWSSSLTLASRSPSTPPPDNRSSRSARRSGVRPRCAGRCRG